MMKRALITGATSGIGKEMAYYLHHCGWQLVLTGRDEAVLRRMAKQFGEGTRWIALDLAKSGNPQKLHDFCRGTRIDLLVNNAGFGVFGAFSETSLEQELAMLDVNIRAVHILTKLFLRDFERQGRGHILNVASSAGFLSGPLMAAYYASKSYVIRLTLAIREELRQRSSPVTVSVLCPGPVDTDFGDRAGVRFSAKPADAAYVARYGIEQALSGRTIIVPTLTMKLALFGAKLCPELPLTAAAYHIQKRKKI